MLQINRVANSQPFYPCRPVVVSSTIAYHIEEALFICTTRKPFCLQAIHIFIHIPLTNSFENAPGFA